MSKIFPLNPTSAKRKPVTVADLYERNKKNLQSHRPMRNYSEIATTEMAGPPILLLTCSDLRCIPEQFFHLNQGEVVMIRSIGGRVETQLSGILAADWMFKFREFVMVHHTDCGATHYTTDGLRKMMRERAPEDKRVEQMEFLEMTDGVQQAAQDDLRFFKDCELVRKELRDHAYAFVHDIKSGEVIPVELQERDSKL
ncbi:carbonic anhydrase [Xylogone sp. PMI_703]|nr:carbonic anhydrase [Xylogone sp. PMI_703]